MDLPGPPDRPPGETRTPVSGLKLMLAILIVFALLAGYGQWERLQRPTTEKATINLMPNVSPSPSPEHN